MITVGKRPPTAQKNFWSVGVGEGVEGLTINKAERIVYIKGIRYGIATAWRARTRMYVNTEVPGITARVVVTTSTVSDTGKLYSAMITDEDDMEVGLGFWFWTLEALEGYMAEYNWVKG